MLMRTVVPSDFRTTALADDDLTFETSGRAATLTHWSFGQLATIAGAPPNYLRSLPASIAADALNYGLRHQSRTQHQLWIDRDEPWTVHAITSPRYARVHHAELARRVLPNGMTIEWTDLSFQEATQGNAALLVFPVSVLLAFLVLAALYESWVLPLAVILIVPMCMLSALAGVKLYGSDNNTFVQVGLVVLMGLACKNAILIVEFARELEFQGKGIVEAALRACRLRLRPIVMTSVAFIAGTIPLVLSQGAGAEVRSATGVTVFAGMIGVTLFGLFLTPVFYVGLRMLSGRKLYVTAQA